MKARKTLLNLTISTIFSKEIVIDVTYIGAGDDS